jgi:hypothetical protein
MSRRQRVIRARGGIWRNSRQLQHQELFLFREILVKLSTVLITFLIGISDTFLVCVMSIHLVGGGRGHYPVPLAGISKITIFSKKKKKKKKKKNPTPAFRKR